MKDIYVYDGTNVLINKLDLRDSKLLDEKYRKQGIGKALYQKVVETAKENNCYEVTLNMWPGNDATLMFYEKMGMKTRSVFMEHIVKSK